MVAVGCGKEWGRDWVRCTRVMKGSSRSMDGVKSVVPGTGCGRGDDAAVAVGVEKHPKMRRGLVDGASR